jgi:hypothetical protein
MHEACPIEGGAAKPETAEVTTGVRRRESTNAMIEI